MFSIRGTGNTRTTRLYDVLIRCLVYAELETLERRGYTTC